MSIDQTAITTIDGKAKIKIPRYEVSKGGVVCGCGLW
jgi:hypothetical protein